VVRYAQTVDQVSSGLLLKAQAKGVKVNAVHTSRNQVPSLEYIKSSMHSNEKVAEYVSICMSCSAVLFDCDGFCCYFLNFPNLSIVVKTDNPVRLRERERK
jgi:hypothetical protein